MPLKVLQNNEVKNIETIRTQDDGYVNEIYSRFDGVEVEGGSSLIFKSIGKDLSNYVISGADGGVGDLETGTADEHYGKYKIPVTVRGKNLFDKTSTKERGYINNDGVIQSEATSRKIYTFDKLTVNKGTTYTLSAVDDMYSGYLRIALFNSDDIFIRRVVSNASKTPIVSLTTEINGYIRLSIDENFIGTSQLEIGSLATDYEPYHEPITTNIYLDEPLATAYGNEDYIDFKNQILHKAGKNLLNNNVSSRVNTGVTFTVNSDKSITANGTSTSNTFSNIQIPMYLDKGTYILSGCPTGGIRNTYTCDLRAKNNIEVVNNIYDTGKGVTLNIPTAGNYLYTVRIQSGYTCDNLTFYPMIRKASVTDDTYEPYIEDTSIELPVISTIDGTNILSVDTEVQPSNVYAKIDTSYERVFVGTREISGEPELMYKTLLSSESTLKDYRIYGNSEVIDGEVVSVGDLVTDTTDEHYGKYKIPVTVRGKNLLKNTATSQTKNGLVFTINNDKSVTVSGTATDIVVFDMNKHYLDAGTYILSGCAKNGSDNTYRQDIYWTEISSLRDFGNGLEFTLPENSENITVRIVIFSGTIMDNVTFYPMIRKADITDDTYEPYHEPITTTLYLDKALTEGESISMSDTGIAIPTISGTNILSVDTQVQPSRVDVKGKIKKST